MNDVKKCPHCGKQLHSTAQYCMYCMTSLQPKQDITPKAQGGKKWVLVLVVLLVVGLLVAVSLAKCGADSSASDANTTEQTHSEPSGQEQIPDVTEQTELTQSATETQTVQPSVEPELPTTEPSQPSTEPEQTTPPTTQPEPVQTQPTTQPEPVQTQPTTAPTQSVCAHYYLAATCLAPMTCTLCGDTVGSADSNAHIWKPVTSVIRHEEVGHYEQVEKSYKKTVYLCFFCGYTQDGFDSMENLRAHMSVHSHYSTYEMVMSTHDLLASTREVWATRTEQQWVVDEEAYDETVTIGHVCTRCNATKKGSS